MNVLEKILEEISEVEKEYVTGHKVEKECVTGHTVLYALGATGMATEISGIIRSHMDEVPDNDSGWIPVSERLPEAGDGKYYPLLNVQTSYGAVKCGFYRVRDDRWYIYEEFYNEFIEANEKEVVAWQTFPEPYKEG